MNRFVMLAAMFLSMAVLADPQVLPKTQKAKRRPTPAAAPKEGGRAPLMVSFTDLKWIDLP
jgi:hypothetical protein